jgi:hypothetical protein
MHGLIFETSIWLLAGSTRYLPFLWHDNETYVGSSEKTTPCASCQYQGRPCVWSDVSYQTNERSFINFTPWTGSSNIHCSTSSAHNDSLLLKVPLINRKEYPGRRSRLNIANIFSFFQQWRSRGFRPSNHWRFLGLAMPKMLEPIKCLPAKKLFKAYHEPPSQNEADIIFIPKG